MDRVSSAEFYCVGEPPILQSLNLSGSSPEIKVTALFNGGHKIVIVPYIHQNNIEGLKRVEVYQGNTLEAVADWVAYIPVHLTLHYFANRKQYLHGDGAIDKSGFFRDAGKVYATQLPSIGLFYLIAGPLHYHLIEQGFSGESANRLSYWGTLLVTRAVHTIIGLKAGIFFSQSNNSSPWP